MPADAWHHTPFYVLCPVSAVLPPWVVYDAMVLGLMLAAGWGMFRLLRERMGVSAKGALLGGAFFAAASQVQPNCIPETVFNYAFPLFYVWSTDLWERREERRGVLVPAAGILLLLALSYPVLSLPYYPLLHLGLTLVDERLEGARRRTAVLVAALWSGYALTCLPALYSLWSYAPQAARRFEPRAPLDPASLLSAARAAWSQLLETSSRVAIFGALPAAAAAWESPRVRRVAALWAALLGAAAFFNSDASRALAGTPLQKMDLSHFSWTLPFAAVLLAAVGAEETSRRPAARRLQTPLLVASVLALAPLAALGLVSRATLELDAAVAIGFLAWTRAGRTRRGASWIRAAAAALVLLSFRAYRASGDEPESSRYRLALEDRSFLAALKAEEPGPWRIGAGSGVPAEILANYGWESVDGRGPIMNRRYKEFFRGIVAPQLTDPDAAAFFDSYWYNLYLRAARGATLPTFNTRLLALANVRYVVSADELPQLAEVAEVRTQTSDSGAWAARWKARLDGLWPWLGRALARTFPPRAWRVYVLRDAFPRGFLADRAALLGSDRDVLAALSGASLADLRSTAFLSASDASRASLAPWLGRPAAGSAGAGRSRLVRYSPDRLEFDVEIPRPSLLVVTNNFHPGWTAAVDGVAAPMLRADHAFQAVPLAEPGPHRVTLEFGDPALGPARAGAAAGALLILLALLPPVRRRSEPRVGLS